MRHDAAANGLDRVNTDQERRQESASGSGGSVAGPASYGRPVAHRDTASRAPGQPTPQAAAAVGAAGRRFEVLFLPAEHRVGQMRDITAIYLRQWSLAPVVEDAVLVVSELVTNAVRHGTGAVGLRVSAGAEELRIEVHDGSTVPARLRAAGEEEESGRGLFLVDALARAWG